jgi:hypothetical protein
MDLNLLLDTYNGTSFLEAGSLEWGYVEPEWYLAFPMKSQYLDTWKPDYSKCPFPDSTAHMQFISVNYYKLLKVLNNPDHAFFGAMLRYHYVNNGVVALNLAERHVNEDEYCFEPHRGDNWEDKMNQIPDLPNKLAITRFIKKFGDTLMQFMVFVFSARGHHWQQNYDALYDKLMNICMVERPISWSLPSNQIIFRQLLHPLGIFLPREFVDYCKNNKRMVAPMHIRFSPNAPVAGVAVVVTTIAVLQRMKNETWYPHYAQKFADQIEVIEEQASIIEETPMDYHVAAPLFTGNQRKMITSLYMPAFNRISQHLLGYLDYLGRGNSLSGQKALTAKSGGMTKIGEIFSKACERLSGIDLTDMSMREFIDVI